MKLQGMILKGIGGFYFVETAQGEFMCNARGKLRKKSVTPYAGDKVIISLEADDTNVIEQIEPRKSFLKRPPVANLDKLFIVSSVKEPHVDLYNIDKMVAVAEANSIEPVVVLTKSDLDHDGYIKEVEAIYRSAGIQFIAFSVNLQVGYDSVMSELNQCMSAFSGNSGVGKSSLLNALFPNLSIKTAEISVKLGRGKHTTREVELYKVLPQTYVADTPGFSTLDIGRYEQIDKDRLSNGFREFSKYVVNCRFTSCTHICEDGCAVIDAVESGEISRSRFKSYQSMYREVKDNKPWQRNKNV